MKKIIFRILIILFLWFVIQSSIISYDGPHDNIHKADCILILGNRVEEDGTLSSWLKSRVDKGLELYQQKYAPYIMVSGGLGKEGFYEGTEMKKYLVNKGVNENNIIVDNEGNNTFLTAKNFKKLAIARNFRSVIIVSQYYHITRTRMSLKKFNIQEIYSAHADYYSIVDILSLGREFLGFYKYLFLKGEN